MQSDKKLKKQSEPTMLYLVSGQYLINDEREKNNFDEKEQNDDTGCISAFYN